MLWVDEKQLVRESGTPCFQCDHDSVCGRTFFSIAFRPPPGLRTRVFSKSPDNNCLRPLVTIARAIPSWQPPVDLPHFQGATIPTPQIIVVVAHPEFPEEIVSHI